MLLPIGIEPSGLHEFPIVAVPTPRSDDRIIAIGADSLHVSIGQIVGPVARLAPLVELPLECDVSVLETLLVGPVSGSSLRVDPAYRFH